MTKGGHVTPVRLFPISVDFKEGNGRQSNGYLAVRSERAVLTKGFDSQADYLGIGVDRLTIPKEFPSGFEALSAFWRDCSTKAASPMSRSGLPVVLISTAIKD